MATRSLDQIIDDIANLKVLELAELKDRLAAKFGVSATMPTMSAMAPAGAAAPTAEAKKEEEKASHKVELLDGGTDKIKTIKALRQVKKDLTLLDAKKAVEEAPMVIAEAASKDEAKAMKEALEAAGAKVKVS
jgi:large subunit ribosomal protein L7/L12